MTKFKVGDRVRCTEDNCPGYEFTAGKEYVVTKVYQKEIRVTDDSGDPNGWGNQYFEPVAPATPIREVTRKEIVPGFYGRLRVHSDGFHAVTVQIPDITSSWGRTELREAAGVFNQLSEALEESQ